MWVEHQLESLRVHLEDASGRGRSTVSVQGQDHHLVKCAPTLVGDKTKTKTFPVRT